MRVFNNKFNSAGTAGSNGGVFLKNDEHFLDWTENKGKDTMRIRHRKITSQQHQEEVDNIFRSHNERWKTRAFDNSRYNLACKGEKIKQVTKFKYLGYLITSDGRCASEISKRIAMAKDAFQKMKPVLANRNISMKTKIRMLFLFVAYVSAMTPSRQGSPMNLMSLLAMRNAFDNFLPMLYFMNPGMMSSMGGGSMAPLFLFSAFS
ncbi:RNA-directed DNA polymerase from mobile element jockey-like [Plakobranchus ocellatus]|uniref:RNA-directed DNA polymerase from mobile element jockey-like n=1 Tax=Plakobranchus ocellatus TaxID=259542 RepID=A0AAV4ASX0_9GAST|nr:RNA-directed DNA polymerase from mobile element jockey-like [Plakobranchus ocellatus]